MTYIMVDIEADGPIAVFLLGVILAAGTSYSLVRLKRKVRGCRLRRLDRLAFTVLWTFAVVSWAFFYVVSTGPVIALADKAGITPSAPLTIFYSPVILLTEFTPLAKPLQAYVDAWRSVLPPKLSWIVPFVRQEVVKNMPLNALRSS